MKEVEVVYNAGGGKGGSGDMGERDTGGVTG